MPWLLTVLLLLLSACSDSAQPGSGDDASPDTSFPAGDPELLQDLHITILAPQSGAVFGEHTAIEVSLEVEGLDGIAGPLSLRWESDRDGALLEEQADGSPIGTTLDHLSPGTHILTVTVTDAANREGDASLVVVVDQGPTGPTVVTLVPDAPTTSDNLEAVITESAQDPEGDPVVYTYGWTVDGIPVTDTTTAVLPAVITTRGEVWTVTVTPSDGLSVGEEATASVEILNTPPSLTAAQVLPSAGGTATPFECQGIGWEDPDDDPETLTFQWTVNEQPVPDITGSNITGEHYVKGDELSCIITPSDPFGAGEPAHSPVIPIVDTPSTVEQVLLEPTVGDVTTTFFCSGDGLDDLDPGDEPFLKTVWVANGEPLPGTSSTEFEPVSLSKGDTVMCRLIPGTVEVDGPPLDSPIVVLGNAPPVAGSVVMEPATPTELTGVTCLAADPTDPDEDNVAYSYEWTVDGEVVEGESGAFLSGDHFEKGQVVSCAAIPFDGEDYGEAASTKFSLVIENSPPSIDEVSVSPAEGSKTDTFTCTPVGWWDPDPGDEAEYTYEWRLNGDVIPGGIFAELVPTGLVPGELTCTVVPGDGTGEGTAVTSAPALLVNHPPSITGVTLEPDPATETSTLTCSPEGWVDQDGDPPNYLFSWSVQGATLDDAQDSTLTGSHFNKGQLVLCIATPTDGVEEGPSHTSNPLQIANSPPSLNDAEVDPPTGGKGTTFTCSTGGYQDADQGDPELVTYTWLVDDTPVEGAVESTLVPGDAAYHGAQIRCQATPFDGTDYGEPVLSGTATVINGPPMVTGVTIVPQEPTALDALSCVATLVVDPEGDDVTFTVVWTRNDAPLPDETEEILEAIQHQEGDKIRCQLTPHDGELPGPGVWSEEVVIGPAPVLDPPQVVIYPLAPGPGDLLTCEVSGADGEIAYTWLVDGEVVDDQTSSTLPGTLVEACEAWTCRGVITGDDGVTPPGEDTVEVGPLAGGDGDILWYGHHGYELGGAPAVGVSQWYGNEKAATLLDLTGETFPLTLTHVRFYGSADAGYNVGVYEVAGGLPADTNGAELASASGVGLGGLTTLALNAPVVLEEPQKLYLSVQGQTDFQTLYGDGDGESTTNMAKACVFLCLLGPPSWQNLAGLGPPFSSMGDLILDAGTATGGESTCE